MTAFVRRRNPYPTLIRQVNVRLTDSDVAELDRLVQRLGLATRADVCREALDRLSRQERQAADDLNPGATADDPAR